MGWDGITEIYQVGAEPADKRLRLLNIFLDEESRGGKRWEMIG